MTTTLDSLVVLAAQLLTTRIAGQYPTAAGPRAYAPRDWPTWDNEYPAIFVSGPRERKASLGPSGAPEFDVTATLRITVRANAAGSATAGAGKLLAILAGLQRQVEVALINNPALMILLEEIGEVRADTQFKASGAEHLGETEIEIDVRFYQGPEDFFVVTGEPLTEVTLATDLPPSAGSVPGFALQLSNS